MASDDATPSPLRDFPPAELLPATRFLGRVVIPEEQYGGDDDDPNGNNDGDAPEKQEQGQQHILCVETTPRPQYFWVQRKIRTTPHGGAVRVGFVLQRPLGDGDDSSSCWKVAVVDDAQQERTSSEHGADELAASMSSHSGNKRAADQELPARQVQMVAIRVEHRARVFAAAAASDNKNILGDNQHEQQQQDGAVANELAALQWVARHSGGDAASSADATTTAASSFVEQQQDEEEYVEGPSVLLAGDAEHVYTIAPYDYYHTGSSSLFDYVCCATTGGVLSEETARGFFRQIVQGLEVLQRVQICHRNLSLESVVLRRRRRDHDPATEAPNNNNKINPLGASSAAQDNAASLYCCTLTQLGFAVRMPPPAGDSGETATTTATIQNNIHSQQPLVGSNPQYVAPELWTDMDSGKASATTTTSTTGTSVSYDGYAADIWSAGVILLALLLGSDALFAAPIPADPVFRRISTTQGLKEFVAKTQKKKGSAAAGTTPISEEAIDLLQRMLRVETRDRLTLTDIQHHPWVRGERF